MRAAVPPSAEGAATVLGRHVRTVRTHLLAGHDQQRRTVRPVAVGSADETAMLVSLIGAGARAER